jgi:hypothetical protein
VGVRPRPTNPDSINAVSLPARWTTLTPKIPATAMLEYAERLSPGDKHHKPGDPWIHQQKLKGLQRLARDLQGFEMIFERVLTGCAVGRREVNMPEDIPTSTDKKCPACASTDVHEVPANPSGAPVVVLEV